ncbi:Hypothetical predicted protein [Olea europaea subsp. europaea]|uniref:Uncharacterized protein n=1 Tax=Olea europaea subsp. europaea TaxID=158383 RepID=A0A8S0VPI0_OLEEU|nr:Hypothetical predicted protein [Olea europaea subsp. europaea]
MADCHVTAPDSASKTPSTKRAEIETLEHVEELQRETLEANRELQKVANKTERRRAVSGIDERQKLVMLEREREARQRNNSMAMQQQQQQQQQAAMFAAASSPRMGLGVPGSPMYGGSQGFGTPRARAVSATNYGLQFPGSPADVLAKERLMQAERAAAMGMRGSPRVRAVSTGLGGPGGMGGSPAAIERMRLEERKRALMERELALQNEREGNLRARKSALNLAEQERRLREREREMQERSMLSARDGMLSREEARLREREREAMVDNDIEQRLRALGSPGLGSMAGSPRLGGIGHGRNLSTPLAVPMMDSGLGMGGMPGGLGGGYTSPRLNGGGALGGHGRSRSIGGSPSLGAYGLDDEMAREAARLGISTGGLVGGLGGGGLGGGGLGGSPYLGGGGGGYENGGNQFNRGGVSPRMAAFNGTGDDNYGDDLYGGLGGGGGGLGRRASIGSLNGGRGGYDGFEGGLDSYEGGLGGYEGGGGGYEGGGGGGMDGFDGGLGGGRGRRDSLPFEERPLFDTRGY